MDRIEEAIVTKLIESALAQKLRVSVNDGEEWVLRRSVDLHAIINALASTDEDYVKFYSERGDYQGTVLLVWGNGVDVIADYSVQLEPLLEPITEYANSLEVA